MEVFSTELGIQLSFVKTSELNPPPPPVCYCLTALSSFYIVCFSLQSRHNQKDTAVKKENVPCVSKVDQASKHVDVQSTNAASAKLNEGAKPSTSKETAAVENNTEAKKEAQKQDDR
jgi:hypothetical protein